MIKLSIIYCTARDNNNLERVKSLLPSWAEIVIIKNQGDKPLGYYRNQAVLQAKGNYIAVVDDDDHIHDNYFTELEKGINKDVDLISVMENQYKDNALIGYSISGCQNPITDGCCQIRGIGHRDAVKRDLVIECGNYDVRYSRGEDAELSTRLHKLLKSAHYINTPIYDYFISMEKKIYDKHLKAPIGGYELLDYFV